jgi:uncharacterized protein (DUF433 family)
MTVLHDQLLARITVDPEVRFGKPCVRGHRITVHEILKWLSSGASQEQILADYPQLEAEDFLAVYAYAAELTDGGLSRRVIEALAINGYKDQRLTQLQVGKLLHFSRIETEDFLARYCSLYAHDPAELHREANALKESAHSQSAT